MATSAVRRIAPPERVGVRARVTVFSEAWRGKVFPEWNHKAVTHVSYGADSGVRAVEHWRTVTANALLQSTRGQLSCSTFSEFDADGAFQPDDRRTGELAGVLDQLEALARAVQTLRS